MHAVHAHSMSSVTSVQRLTPWSPHSRILGRWSLGCSELCAYSLGLQGCCTLSHGLLAASDYFRRGCRLLAIQPADLATHRRGEHRW